MSRFDILRSNFSKWHDDAWAVQTAWRRFPYVLANAVRSYLGAPETFDDISIAEKPRKHSYVMPADANWDSNTSSFNLAISERGSLMREFEVHQNDSRYYFGLVVYLDRNINSFPKQPFWFLLSIGWTHTDLSTVRIQRSGQDFPISTSAYNQDDLTPICEAIEQLLSADLLVSPYAPRATAAS